MTQKEALDILKMGKNVFLTGPAGSGKTYVLNSYINYLKKSGVDVAVTASTGIAATHLGGQTIHSWSGLGVKDTLTDRDIEDLMQKSYLYKRFERTKVLIIDEISMLHHFRLDLIDWICRQFKRSEKPFGGMQVVLCGDFFQLPPVSRGVVFESEFAWKSDAWQRAELSICYLSEQHRQKDKEYLSILNEIRANKVSKETRRILENRLGKDLEFDSEPTRLFTHNIDVDQINNKHLDLISSPIKKFEMISKGSDHLSETLKKSCLSPEILNLKLGAKIMFTKNHPEGLYVNGTLGEISDFNSFGDPVVKTPKGTIINVSQTTWQIEEEGKVKAEIVQYPLRLAWAITVHKSQGMSLDTMEVDLSKSFVRGMGYVALSRVRSLSGMKLLGLNDLAVEVDPEVLDWDMKFLDMSTNTINDLKNMSVSEIERLQKEYLKKIEPEEKIRIKKLNKNNKKSTEEITKEFLLEEVSLGKIAEKRGLTQDTIISHIERLIEKGKCPDVDYLKKEFKRSELDDILDAFNDLDVKILAPVYNLLSKNKKKPTYLKLRLARLFL
ncbi:MAG: AAA family ATPase [Candidatus Paceibacterota bacterium]